MGGGRARYVTPDLSYDYEIKRREREKKRAKMRNVDGKPKNA